MTATTDAVPGPHPGSGDRHRDLAAHVGRRVGALQSAYLADSSSANASLARLRRAVNRQPGSDPAVWQETFDGFPTSLVGAGDEPSRFEYATHAAITLFAIHQQSQRLPMHQHGFGIGGAARRLGIATDSSEAVLRRFQTLGTSTTFDETVYHARALVTQLRAARIPLDYARFAVDLADVQDVRRADGVRLAWGRDYYRIGPTTQPADDVASADTAVTGHQN
ncbi:type I-E CRISPR-associated protein Cse2/CasB [Rhodococcus sp. ABRD24]|uniref:type I-E CRISPR-associated protein Cse2/CasB n=1 Tax=Rhodococcus sp. ABRD24 TaxID=2507582 RepID=UPI0013F176E1|nr:type I-E CRISPR-associated protein Cse2/CasB [Rhodococcus sp. ABRD24]